MKFYYFVNDPDGEKVYFDSCVTLYEACSKAIEESKNHRTVYVTDESQDNISHIYINGKAVFS